MARCAFGPSSSPRSQLSHSSAQLQARADLSRTDGPRRRSGRLTRCRCAIAPRSEIERAGVEDHDPARCGDVTLALAGYDIADYGYQLGPPLGHRAKGHEQRRLAHRRAHRSQGAHRSGLRPRRHADRRRLTPDHRPRHLAALSRRRFRGRHRARRRRHRPGSVRRRRRLQAARGRARFPAARRRGNRPVHDRAHHPRHLALHLPAARATAADVRAPTIALGADRGRRSAQADGQAEDGRADPVAAIPTAADFPVVADRSAAAVRPGAGECRQEQNSATPTGRASETPFAPPRRPPPARSMSWWRMRRPSSDLFRCSGPRSSRSSSLAALPADGSGIRAPSCCCRCSPLS